MPRTKKAAGTAVDTRNGRRTELEGGARLEYFPCPMRRPLVETVQVWELVWQDPVHEVWTPADGPILVRWIEHRDRAVRAARRADRKPVVHGAYEQLTEHPSYVTSNRAVAIVERCEQVLGLGALNRIKLGVEIGHRQLQLAE